MHVTHHSGLLVFPVCFVLTSLSPTRIVTYGLLSLLDRSLAFTTVTWRVPGSCGELSIEVFGEAVAILACKVSGSPTGREACPDGASSIVSRSWWSFLKTPATPCNTPLPAATGIPPNCVMALPALVNVDVCFLVLAMIPGVNVIRITTWPFSPCLGEIKFSIRSVGSIASRFATSILTEPKLFAASI